MVQLIAWYNQYYFFLALALTAVLVALIVEVGAIHSRLAKVKKSYERLFSDAKGLSLEQALNAHMSRSAGNERRIEQLDRDFRRISEDLRNSVQHVGLVRFNPFDDTGGDQSFTVALLDDFENGLVITSLHNRSTTRVYAKPIEKGQPLYPLSDEEKQAIESARKGRG